MKFQQLLRLQDYWRKHNIHLFQYKGAVAEEKSNLWRGNINVAPLIKGNEVFLRQPIEKDVEDFFNVEVSKELVKMYGGDTKNISPKTMELAKNFIDAIKSNKLEWCVEFEGRLVGQARLSINKADNRDVMLWVYLTPPSGI
ncbi:GNAT family N-acetyltransferase [Virgibacillus salexigens]|uniref:GNAT family N-acetyltransferase n=1 Tax=Virgibacillus massiliensis TaxID=1462526 RepID=UPI001EE39913|nr:hypothetical protein [Virgibacillus massiliensis]